MSSGLTIRSQNEVQLLGEFSQYTGSQNINLEEVLANLYCYQEQLLSNLSRGRAVGQETITGIYYCRNIITQILPFSVEALENEERSLTPLPQFAKRRDTMDAINFMSDTLRTVQALVQEFWFAVGEEKVIEYKTLPRKEEGEKLPSIFYYDSKILHQWIVDLAERGQAPRSGFGNSAFDHVYRDGFHSFTLSFPEEIRILIELGYPEEEVELLIRTVEEQRKKLLAILSNIEKQTEALSINIANRIRDDLESEERHLTNRAESLFDQAVDLYQNRQKSHQLITVQLFAPDGRSVSLKLGCHDLLPHVERGASIDPTQKRVVDFIVHLLQRYSPFKSSKL